MSENNAQGNDQSQTTRGSNKSRFLNWPNIIAILAIIVPLVFYFIWQQQRKELAYEVINAAEILTVAKPAAELGQLEILLDGEQITGLVSYTVRIVNTGNVPIVPDDFVTPLALDFGEAEKIIQVLATNANNDLLFADVTRGLTIENTPVPQVRIAPVLLNGGDSFNLNMVTSQDEVGMVKVNGRIVGVGRIMAFDETFPQNLIKLFSSNSFRLIFPMLFSLFGAFLAEALLNRLFSLGKFIRRMRGASRR